MITSQNCPLCTDPHACKGYPLMWQRLRQGRDVAHWTAIHDRINGLSPSEPIAVPKYPSFARQAWNAAQAAAGFVASGFILASPEEQARRLAICQEPCEHYDLEKKRCRKCGCFTKLKTRLASARCPIEKW